MPKKEIRIRLTWLIVGLIASILTALVIQQFDSILDAHVILVSFIPLVVYMSDAVGTQMESTIIREISAPGKFNFKQFSVKQVRIVFPIAVIISVIAAGFIFVLNQEINLAFIVGGALFGGIITSLLTGLLLPYIFWKAHDDPAEASGPLATVIQDFISVMIYLGLASIFY